jgi:DNA-binding MltR family transcriptional regulator
MTSSKNNYKDVMEKYVKSRLKQFDDAFKSKWAEMEDDLDPFLNSLDKFSDRELVILSASLLDDYLETIITTAYIKDEKVKSIFKDEHVLQSFYTKINVAYFSGLIPKWLFNDLRLICEIRNKFAHKFLAKLDLTDEVITKKLTNAN